MTIERTEATRCRQFQATDKAACLSLFDGNVGKYFDVLEREEFQAFLENLPGPYLVGESQGEVFGCGGYAPSDHDVGVAVLCWGMVRRDLHGTGLGKLLLEARLHRIEQEDCFRAVALSTSQHTSPFFQKYGFCVVNTETDGFGKGIDRYDMRLNLG